MLEKRFGVFVVDMDRSGKKDRQCKSTPKDKSPRQEVNFELPDQSPPDEKRRRQDEPNYNEPICPCENEDIKPQSSYHIPTPYITYASQKRTEQFQNMDVNFGEPTETDPPKAAAEATTENAIDAVWDERNASHDPLYAATQARIQEDERAAATLFALENEDKMAYNTEAVALTLDQQPAAGYVDVSASLLSDHDPARVARIAAEIRGAHELALEYTKRLTHSVVYSKVETVGRKIIIKTCEQVAHNQAAAATAAVSSDNAVEGAEGGDDSDAAAFKSQKSAVSKQVSSYLLTTQIVGYKPLQAVITEKKKWRRKTTASWFAVPTGLERLSNGDCKPEAGAVGCANLAIRLVDDSHVAEPSQASRTVRYEQELDQV